MPDIKEIVANSTTMAITSRDTILLRFGLYSPFFERILKRQCDNPLPKTSPNNHPRIAKARTYEL
jgi:hypothetical protein